MDWKGVLYMSKQTIKKSINELKRLVVIEWDANGSNDPDEWDEAATEEELHATVRC